MKKLIKDLILNEDNIDKEVTINGWVRSNRNNGSVGFIEFYDGTSFKSIQLVYKQDLENYNEIKNLKTGSSMQVIGQIAKSKGGNQQYEIKANKIIIYNQPVDDYPMQKKRHSLEFLRTIGHLRCRTNTFLAVFRIRSNISQAIHQFFNKEGFIYLHSPIITANDAEGAGEAFNVVTMNNNKYVESFFDQKASLTVSGQLNAEAFAQSFQKVYTFGPTFRAENSNTSRHAAEFWMVEPEVAFSDLEDNIELAEKFIKFIIKYILKNNKEELEYLNEWYDKTLIATLKNHLSDSFAKMTYDQAIEILKEAKTKGKEFEFNNIEWGIDLQTEHERYICEEFNNKPTFIINYPQSIKAFYMKLNDDNKTVAAMDLLVPSIGELIGGSQREEDYTKLVQQAKKIGLDLEQIQWYLELRNFGYASSAGFGLGLERMVMYLTGMKNIRDVIPFPRTPGNLKF